MNLVVLKKRTLKNRMEAIGHFACQVIGPQTFQVIGPQTLYLENNMIITKTFEYSVIETNLIDE